jgi:hypothetical protein
MRKKNSFAMAKAPSRKPIQNNPRVDLVRCIRYSFMCLSVSFPFLCRSVSSIELYIQNIRNFYASRYTPRCTLSVLKRTKLQNCVGLFWQTLDIEAALL